MIVIIKHAQSEGPGMFGELLRDDSLEISIVESWQGAKLPQAFECEAVISLGGPMNVYETGKFPFLAQEEKLIKEILVREIPYLGICLGAQLLAKVSGAKVKKAEHEEIGWYPIKITFQGQKDPLLSGLGEVIHQFQWHQDSFDIPAEGVLLATSTMCKNQALRVGPCAWGLQFHPEMNKEMLDEWLTSAPEHVDREKVTLEYLTRKDAYEKTAQDIFFNFTKIISMKSRRA